MHDTRIVDDDDTRCWELKHRCPRCRVIDYVPLYVPGDRMRVRCLHCNLVFRRRWALVDLEHQVDEQDTDEPDSA